MFLDFFYELREEGVPVGMQEWMMLMEAMKKGLHGSNLRRFYNLSRSLLVKSETYFDAFDRVFLHVFEGVEGELQIEDEVLDWLKDPKNFQELTEEQKQMLEMLTGDELMQQFLERLAEQTERHDGGGKWVGTGGRSPFGHGGEHPTGIRVGGESRNRSAMKVAQERRFRDYRTDASLDIRQIQMALRRLRQLTRVGPATELDLESTIDETCKNAGEIEFVFEPEKRNNVRLLLLMDVGGTMDPYYEPVSRLLTALHEERGLREFKAYYFHNCPYELLGTTAALLRRDAVPTGDVLRKLDPRWKVMIVGDAAMHPAELMEEFGNIDPRRTAETSGMDWLHRINDHFERAVWLNPDPQDVWDQTHTTNIISKLFPMFHLSVDGIADAVRALIGAKTLGETVH
ncbi:MAG: VWA domain-containing protein [Deltaproteobacteria bacterium]|nr:VWA domain-containing protein [Deltaproteobacteria bacterium]MBW2392908.1 VWA domain-containing protein [Deltaproteobacteria bacterium]